MKKVVVIGGRTGTFTVLRGIKYLPNIEITAIVTSADSGGSTGVLRDEFGNLPVGDFISNIKFKQNKADKVKRSLLRHDSDKLASEIKRLIS